MKVYLVRHGQYVFDCAGASGPALSAYGWEQARGAGRFLCGLGARPGAVWVSPYVRSQETARGIVEVLGPAVEAVVPEVFRELLPEGAPEEMQLMLEARAAADPAGEVLVVGHMGSIGRLARLLDPLAPWAFGLCTVAVFEWRGEARWELVTVKDCSCEAEA